MDEVYKENSKLYFLKAGKCSRKPDCQRMIPKHNTQRKYHCVY